MPPRVFFLFPLATSLSTAEPIGSIVRHDPALEQLIAPDAKIEYLAGGFTWSEGPAWEKAENRLLFSDVPNNTVHSWSEKDGLQVYLQPSGYTGPKRYSKESGSNGLAFDAQGRLISCEHGDRRVSILTKNGGKRTLADNYQGKRFNSPNDLTIHSSGAIFFTDPPYGLPKNIPDAQELEHYGVYRIDPDKTVTLVIDNLERPNGITLSPDNKTLYVAQSHRPAPHIIAYPVNDDLSLGEAKILFDATEQANQYPGMPDGLKVDTQGNIWTTGPGGVLIISPEGKLLGHILTNRRTANCAFGDDGSTLYMTADDDLLRLKVLAKGHGF
ncbi:MAG: SMP-30/gluconolactonase/LRE family protein [Verrucomicrobiota bacterium]